MGFFRLCFLIFLLEKRIKKARSRNYENITRLPRISIYGWFLTSLSDNWVNAVDEYKLLSKTVTYEQKSLGIATCVSHFPGVSGDYKIITETSGGSGYLSCWDIILKSDTPHCIIVLKEATIHYYYIGVVEARNEIYLIPRFDFIQKTFILKNASESLFQKRIRILIPQCRQLPFTLLYNSVYIRPLSPQNC